MNILVVDDEQLIREGLVDFLEESDFVWENIFAAENALQAKKIIESYPIDLAIVDVRMPGKSGLELIERFKDTSIRFILITAYREFDYIQKAIKLSVIDFVEKPIDDEELNAAITKAIDVIEKEKVFARYEHKAVLLEVLRGRKRLPSLSADYILSVLIFQVAHYVSYRQEIISLAEKIFKDNLIDYVQAHEDTHVLLINAETNKTKIEEFIRHFNEVYRVDLAAALSSSLTAKDLDIMYQEAKLILEAKLYWGYNKLLDKSHSQVHKKIPWQKFNELKLKFRVAIESLNLMQARLFLKDIMQILQDSQIDFLSLSTITFDLSFMIYNQRLLLTAQKNECEFDFLNHWEHLEEAYAYLENELDDLQVLIDRSHNFQDEALEIVDYVKDRFDQALTLYELSEVFLMSEASIRNKIKQITGMTFTSYLTYIRMLEAMHLLVETDLPVSHISNKCGYQDYRYFSTVFKKHTGFSPSQYRQKTLE